MNPHCPPPLCTGGDRSPWISRRRLLDTFGHGLGGIALATLLNPSLNPSSADASEVHPQGTHFAPKAKRVIFLLQSGAPSQMDLFDYKPELNRLHGQELPESVRGVSD